MGKRLLPFWLLAFPFLISSPAASPFSVAARYDSFEGKSAVRVSFEFPAGHHLYSSFTVADPSGTPLVSLFVPAPDTHQPDDPEASHSKPFSAFYAPPAADSIVVAYQGCKGDLCFLPEETTLALGDAPAVVD